MVSNGPNGTNGVVVPQPNGISQPNGTSHDANGTNGTHDPSSYAAKFDLADHFIGGNRVEAAPSSSVKDFVVHNDGHTVITSVSRVHTKRSIHTS